MNAYAFELDEELAAAKGFAEVMDIQLQRQAVTLIGTIVGGGGMAGTIKSIDYVANRERRAMGKIIKKVNKRRGAEFEQERLDNMIYLAQASKTNQRAADQFESFMNKAAPDQKVYMSAEGIDLLNDPPAYITEQMDGSGGDVAIPLSTFLKDFANDEAKLALVRPHIKTSEGMLNQTEIEEDNDAEYIQTLLAKANEATETKNAADEIYERITAQLVATGRQSAATARQSATLIPALVTTKYEELKREGKTKPDGSEWTLEDVFSDFGLEIVGPEVDVAAADFMTQEEATEIDQAAAKGLDISVEGREARAREQGYDTEVVYYHGTSAEFDEFATPEGVAGHFTTSAETASGYGTQVMPTFLKFQKPLTIMDEDWRMLRDNPHRMKMMRDAGYDAAISDDTGDVIVFEPTQIRSVHAAFDPDFSASPRVLAQQNLGSIELTETRVDQAGNALEITENAGVLWKEQQQRAKSIEQLRRCLRA
jgi:hypothetical protein